MVHHILAYADDVVLLAKYREHLQVLLDLINSMANKIGLTFNPAKCVTMHYACKKPSGARNTVFLLDGQAIPIFMDGVPHVFLGKPVVFFT